MPPTLVCSRTDSGPDTVWVHAAGELDLATAPQLERMLRSAQSQRRVVVLDLRAVDFIDSAGVRAIVEASVAARKAGRRLVVLRGAATVDRMFRLARASDVVETSDVDPTGLGVSAPFQEGAAL